MFQTFDSPTAPENSPPRLAALRAALQGEGLAGFLVPRSDAHQGEYVAPHDERLAWLTGFTGSAGMAAILRNTAALFVDGRYRVQGRAQVPAEVETVPWPEVTHAEWLVRALPDGGEVGFDPWLHTTDQVETLLKGLADTGVTLRPVENLVDRIWPDQPAPPQGAARAYPTEFAGQAHDEKRARIAQVLDAAGQDHAILTLPDSIAWLLNIRGADIARIPVVQAFAILHRNGHLTLFADPAKFDDAVRGHLGAEVTLRPPAAFDAALRSLTGSVRVDRATAPMAVAELVRAGTGTLVWGDDPCILPKACKSEAEIAGTAEAHLRDGAAMVEFLAKLQADLPGGLTEIDVVTRLEAARRATNALQDISFDTIAGAGPNGAIVHYRVTEQTNRKIAEGELLLIDSGGQYLDGTTDITRTIAVGTAGAEERRCFTRVLQGMIAISRARWPKGLAGRDLDALARYHLWLDGLDYDHGTGHGVGHFLSVHEGPQRLSRISHVPLQPGMILSNEPGYYREGAFGIRIENLVVVQMAPDLPGADARAMLSFDTLTWVPIDRALIDTGLLSQDEIAWIDEYHAQVRNKLENRVSDAARNWLFTATQPL